MPIKANNQAKMYKILSANFLFLNQIYNNIFQNIAEPIYPHISTKDLIHQAVVVYQEPFVAIWIHFTAHQVISAKNACPNSCSTVTTKVNGYITYSPNGTKYFKT